MARKALILLIIGSMSGACVHAPFELHLYGDSRQKQVREIIEAYADTRGFGIKRPRVAPAESDAEVTLVYGKSNLAICKKLRTIASVLPQMYRLLWISTCSLSIQFHSRPPARWTKR